MDVLLRLGDFKFAMDTAAFHELTRQTEYHWPTQDRLWNRPAVQFTGIGDETIELVGRVLPLFRGGLAQIDRLRELAAAPAAAAQAEPMPLVTGWGHFMGEWVITRIEEVQGHVLTRGAPGEQTFRMHLRYYARDLG